jgi:hypothetical protein
VGQPVLKQAQAHAPALADHAIDADLLTEAQTLANTQWLLDARHHANAPYE